MPRTIFARRQQPVRVRYPDERQILEEGLKKRCAQCWWVWPASEIKEVDGYELCPNCQNITSIADKVRAEEEFADRLARYADIEPQISQAPLAIPTPPTVNFITDAAGVIIAPSSRPLLLTRNIAATVLLIGVNFSSADTIAYSSGITNAAAIVRTPVLTTLAIIADLALAPGPHYHLTFNGVTYRDAFCVR